MRKIFDLGITPNLSATDQRYVRTINIVTLMGVVFMLLWTIFAFLSIESHLPTFFNGAGAALFAFTFYINVKRKPVLAGVWLISIAYLQLLSWIYFYGYNSGVGLINVLIILPAYLIFPRRVRHFSHLFAIIGCLTWVLTTVFQGVLIARVGGIDSHLHLSINVILVSVSCLIFVWSLSNTVDTTEEFLDIERRKSDKLLHNILPKSIAERLKEKDSVIADGFESVSVLFADIVGFTKLSEKLTPQELVVHLNEVFTNFDQLAHKHGLEKIKTIGDAYMVSAGLPDKDPDHNIKIALFALDVSRFMAERKMTSTENLEIRIGIHTGPAVAGVIGIKKFAYDLWGDTVNTASRMESHGEAGKIHVSEDFYEATSNLFEFEKRAPIEVKGKGKMQTYFLLDKKL